MIMQFTGIGAMMGGTPNPGLDGGDDEEAEMISEEDIEEFEGDQRGPDDFLGLAIAAVSWTSDLIGFVVLAPIALQNMGLPATIATALALPIWAITAFFIVTVLRGIGIL